MSDPNTNPIKMNEEIRIYANYYSKKQRMFLNGRVSGKKGMKVLFEPFRKTVGAMWVPVGMLKYVVAVTDSGPVKSFAL
jgi:hypothetical protein